MKIQQSITNSVSSFDPPLADGMEWRATLHAFDKGITTAYTANASGDGLDVEGARLAARLALANHCKAVLAALAEEK